MAGKDFYHECVCRALVKEGWTITHEPLLLPFADTRLEVDLGAKRSAAERGAVLIAVEVKNFLETKPMVSEYQKSQGQYQLYRKILRVLDPERTLYLGAYFVLNRTGTGLSPGVQQPHHSTLAASQRSAASAV